MLRTPVFVSSRGRVQASGRCDPAHFTFLNTTESSDTVQDGVAGIVLHIGGRVTRGGGDVPRPKTLDLRSTPREGCESVRLSVRID